MVFIDAAVVLALAFAVRVDLAERRIPDVCSAVILIAGLAGAAFRAFDQIWLAVLGVTAGLGLMIVAATLSSRRAGTPALGGGDVKLVAALGAWLGLSGVPWLVLIAAVLGLFAFAGARLIVGPAALRTGLPFAPCIALAALIVRWLDPARLIASASNPSWLA